MVASVILFALWSAVSRLLRYHWANQMAQTAEEQCYQRAFCHFLFDRRRNKSPCLLRMSTQLTVEQCTCWQAGKRVRKWCRWFVRRQPQTNTDCITSKILWQAGNCKRWKHKPNAEKLCRKVNNKHKITVVLGWRRLVNISHSLLIPNGYKSGLDLKLTYMQASL